MRSHVDAEDLRRWRDDALVPLLEPGLRSRRSLLAELRGRVKSLRVVEPGGRGDGFGSLDLDDVLSPTFSDLHEHSPWLCESGGNRFSGERYSVEAYVLWGGTDNATVVDVDQVLLDDTLDVLLDMALPLAIAAHTLRETTRDRVRDLLDGGVPSAVNTVLKDAFKRDDALLREAFRPALWRRGNMTGLEKDVMGAAREFAQLIDGPGGVDDGTGIPPRVGATSPSNVLTVLDRFAAKPAVREADRVAATTLADAVRRTWPGAGARTGRREARGGDAMGKIRPADRLHILARAGHVDVDGEAIDPDGDGQTRREQDRARLAADAAEDFGAAVGLASVLAGALTWVEDQVFAPTTWAAAEVLRAARAAWPGSPDDTASACTWRNFVLDHLPARASWPAGMDIDGQDVLETTMAAIEHVVARAYESLNEVAPGSPALPELRRKGATR